MDFKNIFSKLKLQMKKINLFWQIILAAVFVATVFFLGEKVGRNDALNNFSGNSRESRRAGTKFTSPLLDCGTKAEFMPGNIAKIKEKTEEEIKKKTADGEVSIVSMYFRDLNNGPAFGINEGEKFTPASLMKVPLMIAYLKMAEKDPGLLEKKYTYQSENKNQIIQNITPEVKLQDGKEYSVEEIMRIMVIYSDNNAGNFLLKKVDEKILAGIYSDLDVSIPEQGNSENYMSVKDYAGFFRILYNASYLNVEMSEKALQILSEIDFKDGLVAGVPDGTKVAQKFGERKLENTSQLHDCGIIYYPYHPYLLCVMTRGNDLKKLGGVISGLSKIVYGEVGNIYK
jgi:beta-lactamase class A